jgi:hypothetical protein
MTMPKRSAAQRCLEHVLDEIEKWAGELDEGLTDHAYLVGVMRVTVESYRPIAEPEVRQGWQRATAARILREQPEITAETLAEKINSTVAYACILITEIK